MASASSSYSLRPSAHPQQFERPSLRKRLPSTTRVDQEKDSDIYILSQKTGESQHTYLSLDQHHIKPVAPETYVSDLAPKFCIPDPTLRVAASSIQGSGVFTNRGQTFLEKEILSSYSMGARFAFRLKHHDWVDDRRTSCFLAFVIGEDNQIHPVSQYQFILWTHVRVQWKHRKDIQLGIFPADRPIRMINHQKAAANAEVVTIVDPAIYQFMAKERSEEAELVPVVGAQDLLDACTLGAPLPVQVILQAKKQIGPTSEELFFDYFEADDSQEEFDPTYEFVWISWNQRMKDRIEALTQLRVSDAYAPPFCSADPLLPPREEETLLHNRLIATYQQARQGNEEDLQEFIQAFVRHWNYHHPQMQLILTDDKEADDTWHEDNNASVHSFYTELIARLNGKVPVPNKPHNRWGMKELGDYLMNSDLFGQVTYDRLINPKWLHLLSKRSNSQYKFLLKRYVRQHLADDQNVADLSNIMIRAGLPDCKDKEIFTIEKLNIFIERYKLDNHESMKKLARAAYTYQTANHKLRSLIASGSTDAAKALVQVFIKEFGYTIKTLIKGPLNSLCITGSKDGKRTSISQLVGFINTYLPTKSAKLIQDPLLVRAAPSSDEVVLDVTEQRLQEIWDSVQGVVPGGPGRKTREEMLKNKFISWDCDILIWFECYIRHCFTRQTPKNGGSFSPALTSALNFRCPLTSLRDSLLARQIPAIRQAIRSGQETWGQPLLLQVCAYLGINNLRIHNGHLLAVWVAYEMDCPPDYPLTDRHAKLLHPEQALTIPSDEGEHDPQVLPNLGQLVDWETSTKCDVYSDKVRSALARLWYSEPLNRIIKEQLQRSHYGAAGYLNAAGIPAPDGANRWTVESLSEYCLRNDLTDHHIEFVRPICERRGEGVRSRKRKNRIDKRHFSVFIAEHLPYCWFLCPGQTRIPEGLEDKVTTLRETVEREIKENPDNYEEATLVPLARGGFISASNEMIRRVVPTQRSDGLQFITKLRTPGICVWYNNEWHWPSYSIVLKAIKQGSLVSKARQDLFQRMWDARLVGHKSTEVAASSSTASALEESDYYDSDESEPLTESGTQPPSAKRPRLI